MAIKRGAKAVWKGTLKEGEGTLSTDSKGLNSVRYSFHTRFEDGIGVNPEELIAAAHAACFSMATSAQLNERGIVPDSVSTTCTVTMENLSLTHSHLECAITAPGAEHEKVREAAESAKSGCPISKALNLSISLDLAID